MRICMHGFYHVQSCTKLCKVVQSFAQLWKVVQSCRSWVELGKVGQCCTKLFKLKTSKSIEFPWNYLKSLISLINLSLPLSEFPWNLLNYFEIPWITLKSLWIPSKPFDFPFNPVKTFQISDILLILDILELPWIVWKTLKLFIYLQVKSLSYLVCLQLKSSEIHWNPMKVLEISLNSFKSLNYHE